MFVQLKIAELERYQNVVNTLEDNDVFIHVVCIASASNITIYQKGCSQKLVY